MKIKKGKTARGFALIEFEDHSGIKCSFQQSSLATEDACWLGCDEAEPKVMVHGQGWKDVPMPPDYIANTRMHLTRKQVIKLLPYLKGFAETGWVGRKSRD